MNLERTFFVTTVAWKRTPIFRQHASAQLMVDVLKHYAEQGKFVLHEFVIMPDHLHLLLTPAKDISLERALQVIKGGFSYRLGKKHGPVWEGRFSKPHRRPGGGYLPHGGGNPVESRRGANVGEGEALSSEACRRGDWNV